MMRDKNIGMFSLVYAMENGKMGHKENCYVKAEKMRVPGEIPEWRSLPKREVL